MSQILKLDSSGQPSMWISWKEAACYHAKGLVSWEVGKIDRKIMGGDNRFTGDRSSIVTSSIIAVRGETGKRKHRAPALNNRELFNRDRHLCAYCLTRNGDSKLTRDHIIPKSRGGQDIWMNVVTACARCNQKKDARTPEEAGMQLHFAPYVPSRAEHLILANRNILADQMEFLMSFVDEKSRLRIDLANAA